MAERETAKFGATVGSSGGSFHFRPPVTQGCDSADEELTVLAAKLPHKALEVGT